LIGDVRKDSPIFLTYISGYQKTAFPLAVRPEYMPSPSFEVTDPKNHAQALDMLYNLLLVS
jgi:hypothetical protein